MNAKGIFNLTISSFVFMLSGYVVNIWLGRALGPLEYGIYGVIISLMTTINIIQTSGVPQSVSKFIASKEDSPDAVLQAGLRIQIASTLVISFLFYISAGLLARLLNDVALTPYIQAASAILPFYSIFSLYTGYYNGLHEFRKQALLYIAYSIAKVVLVIGLIYVFRLYGAIIGFALSPLVALFYGFRMPKSDHERPTLYRGLAIFSVPLVAFAILSTLLISIDIFFVKALLANGEAAGLYSAAQNIGRIPYFALAAFAAVLFPTVARSLKSDEAALTAKKIRDNVRLLLLLLIPSTALIMMTSGDLLRLLYSDSYGGGAAALSWLAFGLALVTVFGVLANVINAAARPSASMAIAALGVVVTAASCSILIPLNGLVGAAQATTIGGAVALATAIWATSRRVAGIVPWTSAAKMIVAALGMYALELALGLPLFLLPLEYVLLFALYGAVLFFLGEITADDAKMVRNLMPKEPSAMNIE